MSDLAPEPSDFDLLAQWGEGDATAGRTLVRRHTPCLHRFFASKAPDVLHDLVQATLLAAVESRQRYRAEASFRAFVLGIARNLLLKHVRKQLRGRRAIALEAVCVHDVTRSPSRVVARRQQVRLLVDALRRIPIDQQIALELYYWEELEVGEIASVLQVAPGTIRSRLARARDALRGAIASGRTVTAFERSTADELEHWVTQLRGLEVTPDR